MAEKIKPNKKPRRSLKVAVECKLKQIRESINLPQRELCRYLGVSHGHLYFIEKGSGVSVALAIKIAKYLNVKVEDIWILKEDSK